MQQTATTINTVTQMTKTDHLQWASASVDGVEMHVTPQDQESRIAPTVQVEIRYTWKGRRFTKTIHSVMN